MGVMSVAYTTINGQIVSEKRNGVPSDYIPDALGSTIALLSDTHQITDTWTYWPNGQVRTRTGTNPTPHTFCGTVGYHSDLLDNSNYVRARQLRVALNRWQTLDPVWPSQPAYTYGRNALVTWTDPSGKAPLQCFASIPVTPQPLPCLYGNYCGPCNGNGGKDPWIDDLDKCCKAHDQCLATLGDWINPITYHKCQCVLSWCAANADCG